MLKTIRKESVFQQYIWSQKYSFVLFEQIVLSKLGIILFYCEIFKFIKLKMVNFCFIIINIFNN